MAKQSNQHKQQGGGNQRGGNQYNQRGRGGARGGGNRGGRGGRGERGGRGLFNQGPPSFVIPFGTYMHRSENCFVVKCTDPSRVPKFNRGLYLQNKAKIGVVDQILGPVNSFYFSVKPVQGVNSDGFKQNQVFYMSPQDLLPMDRFTKKNEPAQKRPTNKSFNAKPQGSQFKGGGNKPGGWNKKGPGNWKNKPIQKQ